MRSIEVVKVSTSTTFTNATTTTTSMPHSEKLSHNIFDKARVNLEAVRNPYSVPGAFSVSVSVSLHPFVSGRRPE